MCVILMYFWYSVSEFKYNKNEDFYTCPAGEILKSNGNWYQKKSYRVKQYKTKNCKNCPVKSLCTKAKYQKIIERHEFAEALEINKQNIAKNPEIYAQRQSIVEHPFGTMKRQWGFDHIMTKNSMKRAAADVGFIFIAYNLKRIMNIIGLLTLIALFSINKPNKYLKTALESTFSTLKYLKSKLSIFANNCLFQNTLRNFSYF